MAESSIIAQILVIILASILAYWAHEGWHWLFGRLAGGKPFISGWHLYPIIPGEIDFEQPQAMPSMAVRWLAAGGPIALVVLFTFSVTTSGTANYYLRPRHLAFLIFFGVAGGATSWLDLFAIYAPDEWKRFTAGESIRRDDFE
jgi:hypothetical protein